MKAAPVRSHNHKPLRGSNTRHIGAFADLVAKTLSIIQEVHMTGRYTILAAHEKLCCALLGLRIENSGCD